MCLYLEKMFHSYTMLCCSLLFVGLKAFILFIFVEEPEFVKVDIAFCLALIHVLWTSYYAMTLFSAGPFHSRIAGFAAVIEARTANIVSVLRAVSHKSEIVVTVTHGLNGRLEDDTDEWRWLDRLRLEPLPAAVTFRWRL